MPQPLSAPSKASLAPPTLFADATGAKHKIADFKGHYVLVNLWATWCAPCVSELPALAKLQATVPGLKVVAVAEGHDQAAAAPAFLKSHKIAELGTYLDTDMALLKDFGAYGLPATVLIDPNGKEIANAQGPGQWASPAMVAYFKDLTKS